MKPILSYALIAATATGMNITVQDMTVYFYSGRANCTVFSMVLGTGIGLVVKYMLDKRYVFHFQARDAAHDTRKFALYAAMGLATTIVFWGFELGFGYVFTRPAMRYVGAVIGLSIGYSFKYYLDRRFVFGTDVPQRALSYSPRHDG